MAFEKIVANFTTDLLSHLSKEWELRICDIFRKKGHYRYECNDTPDGIREALSGKRSFDDFPLSDARPLDFQRLNNGLTRQCRFSTGIFSSRRQRLSWCAALLSSRRSMWLDMKSLKQVEYHTHLLAIKVKIRFTRASGCWTAVLLTTCATYLNSCPISTLHHETTWLWWKTYADRRDRLCRNSRNQSYPSVRSYSAQKSQSILYLQAVWLKLAVKLS